MRKSGMSDFVPKPGTIKIGGLGRQAQKLQAAKEKAANVKSGAKPGTRCLCQLLQGQQLVRRP